MAELPFRTVEIVAYIDGKRNVIGEADVTIWPGERYTIENIVGVVPIFFNFDPNNRGMANGHQEAEATGTTG